MKKILLNDLLCLGDLPNTRVRLVKSTPDGNFKPINDYKRDPETLMGSLLWNYEKKGQFQVGQIVVGLMEMGNNRWLLFTVCKITKDLNVRKGTGYDSEVLDQYSQYFGRVVVRYPLKEGEANLVQTAAKILPELEVVEVLPSTFNKTEFPGYKHVTVRYPELKVLLAKDEEWQNKLKAVKAVYLITDLTNGKHYVGSAYGQDGLYGRWSVYTTSGYDNKGEENGEYPNKGLREVVKSEGLEYIEKHFQYSILEIFNPDTDTEDIIKRESWWKEAIGSRKFGYNRN